MIQNGGPICFIRYLMNLSPGVINMSNRHIYDNDFWWSDWQIGEGRVWGSYRFWTLVLIITKQSRTILLYYTYYNKYDIVRLIDTERVVLLLTPDSWLLIPFRFQKMKDDVGLFYRRYITSQLRLNLFLPLRLIRRKYDGGFLLYRILWRVSWS